MTSHEFHIVPDDFNVDCDVIIGKNFLATYKCRIDYSDMTFSVQSAHCANILKISNSPDGNILTIPPRCEVIRQFVVNATSECVIDHLTLAPGVYTSRTIVNPKNAFIRIINTTDKLQKVSRKIEHFEPLENFYCYKIDDVPDDHERTDRLKKTISKNVPEQYRKDLFKLIEEFPDIFSRTSSRFRALTTSSTIWVEPFCFQL